MQPQRRCAERQQTRSLQRVQDKVKHQHGSNEKDRDEKLVSERMDSGNFIERCQRKNLHGPGLRVRSARVKAGKEPGKRLAVAASEDGEKGPVIGVETDVRCIGNQRKDLGNCQEHTILKDSTASGRGLANSLLFIFANFMCQVDGRRNRRSCRQECKAIRWIKRMQHLWF